MTEIMFVRRDIFNAAKALEDMADECHDFTSLELAEMKISDYQAASYDEGAKFWRAVWVHLMAKNHRNADIRIVDDEPGPPRPLNPLGQYPSRVK